MPQINLRLLGGFEAAWPSGASLCLPTKKAKALLAYCALRPGQVHQRDALATLLWGDTEDSRARNSLRQTLFGLRAALGDAWPATLRIEGDTIATHPSAIDVDVLRFERLASEQTPQALGQATALYTGDLLEGFVVDEDPFEQWLFQERERLRDLALEVLARLLRQQDALGMTTPSIQTARRLLALDPLHETVHRVLMRLYAQAGRREAALRQYEVCAGLLRRELRLEPEPETGRLYEKILAGQGPAPVTPPPVVATAREIETADVTEAPNGAGSSPHGAGSRAEAAERQPTTTPHSAPSLVETLTATYFAMQEITQAARIRVMDARELTRASAESRALLRRTLRETTEAVMDFKNLLTQGDSGGSPSPEAVAGPGS